MTVKSRLKYEAAGVIFLVGTGIAAVVADPVLSLLLPELTVWILFLVIAAVLLGATTLAHDSGGTPETAVDPAGTGILDVDLVDWANARVGTECLRCETEIKYYPLGTTEGQSEHRIECGCTIIHSTPAE